MNGPLGGVPPAEQLMTIERDDRDGCLVLVVHGEVDLKEQDILSRWCTMQ
jgi:anti-sigma B factor antagonist